jgi:hypothetical protein
LYLNQKQVLGAWYQQIIKTPINLGSQSSPMVQMTPWQILTTGFTFLFLALTFLTLCITISRLRSIFFGKSLPLSFISTAILAIIACYFALRYQIDPELNNSPKNWSLLAIQWLPLGFWHLTAILGVFLVSAGTMRFLYLKVVRAKVIQPWLDSFEIKLVFLACINSLLFIYPNVGNLWTSALPISIFVLKILHLKSLESNKVTRQMLFSNSVGKSAQILLLSLSVLGLGLIPVANSSMDLKFQSPDLKYLKTNRLCPFGLSAFPDKEYLANSPNWGEIVYTTGNRDASELKKAKFVIVCKTSYDDFQFVLPSRFKLVQRISIENEDFISLYRVQSE